MKIAILTPTFSYFSGIDRVAQIQARNYARRANQVTVFALDAQIKPKGYRLRVLGMPKNPLLQRIYRLFFFLDFTKISRAASLLKGYDEVVSHFYPMNVIASRARRKYGIKYVYYNHGIPRSGIFENFAEKIYIKLFSFFSRLSIKNADSAISISKFLQLELKKETGLDSKVVCNRIDKKRFRKGLDGSRIRKNLGINEGDKLLLFVGRLSPHKNVHGLLEIFHLLKEKFPAAKLLIVGKPAFKRYYKMLKKMAGKDVIFINFLDDKELPLYYAACDLYVTASLWEGFDLPILEAQSCGKKIVAFDLCSHPEVVEQGALVKEGDIDGFVDSIIRLLK